MSPDGAHVYATGGIDGAVVVFARDAATGKLTFVEAQIDGEDGVDGLEFARKVTLSPDGAHVYVSGGGDNAIAVFERNATTGKLSFVEAYFGGVVGPEELGVWSVSVSPDGRHVYVTALEHSAVSVFARDGASGALTLVEVLRDGVGGVDGIDGAWGLGVSPDGTQVYVTGALDEAVAVFERDAATGRLSFLEAQVSGVGGVSHLKSANAVAVSPDNARVYVSAWQSNAITVFAREGVNSTLLDADGDELYDSDEATLNTDPLNPDSDGDGTKDGREVDQGRNPLLNEPAVLLNVILPILYSENP